MDTQIQTAPALLLDQFRRALRAKNMAVRTVETYLTATEGFGQFLSDWGMPTTPAHLRREHVEAFIEDLLSWCSSSDNRRARHTRAVSCVIRSSEVAAQLY